MYIAQSDNHRRKNSQVSKATRSKQFCRQRTITNHIRHLSSSYISNDSVERKNGGNSQYNRDTSWISGKQLIYFLLEYVLCVAAIWYYIYIMKHGEIRFNTSRHWANDRHWIVPPHSNSHIFVWRDLGLNKSNNYKCSRFLFSWNIWFSSSCCCCCFFFQCE